MPYKPTGRPNGRPRKEFPLPAKRAFVAALAPSPRAEPIDTAVPMMGQRKRPKQRRPMLIPLPVKV